MNIREFQETHRDFCNRYNKNLDLYYRCSEYIEQEGRTPAEIEKYSKNLNTYAKVMSEMMIEYKKIDGKEMNNRTVLGGFILYDKVI